MKRKRLFTLAVSLACAIAGYYFVMRQQIRPVLGIETRDSLPFFPSWRPYPPLHDIDENRLYLDAGRNYCVFVLCPASGLTEDPSPAITPERATFFPSSKLPIEFDDCHDALDVIDEGRRAVRIRLSSGEVLAWCKDREFPAPAQWDTSRTLRDAIRTSYRGPDAARLLEVIGPPGRPYHDTVRPMLSP